MAIDRTGITSLNAGAGEITYSGNQGPKSPDQQLMAQADPMLVDEYNKSPLEQATEFFNLGFKNIHIVDLNAALDGNLINKNII